MPAYRIALVPGDHIGPEVTTEARKVLAAAATAHGSELAFDSFPWGAQHYLDTGAVMPDDGPDTLRQFDAIFLGAMGDPARLPDRVLSWGFTQRIRKRFRQYVNLRPVKLWPGVRSPLARPGMIDLVVVRENAEGEYTNIGGPLYAEQDQELAIQTSVYTRQGIERVVRYAFELARRPGRRKHVTSVSKANALPYGMVLWDRVFAEVAEQYPDVQTHRLNVDAAAMYLIAHPDEIDVLVAGNLFGDILSDEAAAVAGGIGLAPGGNVNPERQFPSMFEPIHGSAPDIGGQGIANPLAAILAGAMLLRFLSESPVEPSQMPAPGQANDPDRHHAQHTQQQHLLDAANTIEAAVAQVLRRGQTLTPDLGGESGTAEVGDAVVATVAAVVTDAGTAG